MYVHLQPFYGPEERLKRTFRSPRLILEQFGPTLLFVEKVDFSRFSNCLDLRGPRAQNEFSRLPGAQSHRKSGFFAILMFFSEST